MKILTSPSIIVHVDEREELGGSYVNTYEISMKNRTFSDVQSLLDEINRQLYWNATNPSDWTYNDFDGRIMTNEFVDDESNPDADGDYIATASVGISIISEPRFPTYKEARAMGFEL